VFYGWRITASSFMILFVIVGIVYYSFPVFYPSLIQEFGWSRAEVTAGFFYSILIVGPIFGITAGFLIDRFGTKRVLAGGLIAAGGAFLGFFSMHSLSAYYLFYFLQSIGYVSAGPIPNQVLISQWFQRLRGRAMGIAYVGVGVGGAIAPLLSAYLVRHYGWRAAMFAIAGIIFLVLLPVVFFTIKNRPADMDLTPDGEIAPGVLESNRGSLSANATLGKALKTRSFWMILVGSSLSIGAVGGIIQHLQLFLRDRGFSAEAAARVASLLLVSSIAGRLVMGYLADRFPKKHVMTAAFLIVGAAIPLLNLAHLPWTLYGFAIIFGFGMGADYMLIPLVTAQCFGVAALGRLMGVILTSDAVSQAFAPVIVGRLFDHYQNYNLGFIVLTACALAAGVAATQIRHKEP
jgi:sugar phosphate permease